MIKKRFCFPHIDLLCAIIYKTHNNPIIICCLCYIASVIVLTYWYFLSVQSHIVLRSFLEWAAILTDLRTKYSYIADVEVTYFIEAPFYSVKCMEHMKLDSQDVRPNWPQQR